MDVPRLSPSSIAELRFCPYKHFWRKEQHLGPTNNLDPAPVLGTLYHEAAASEDLGKEWVEAVDRKIADITMGPTFIASQLNYDLLDQLKAELVPIMRQYKDYSRKWWGDWYVVDVEKQLEVALPTGVLVTIPDAVLRHKDTNQWVVKERKTTSREDSSWSRKFLLSIQTTAEAVAVERTYHCKVDTVFIEPVIITRKRASNWGSDLPQPISNVRFMPLQPVPKTELIKRNFLQVFEETVKELEWRRTNGIWTQNYGSCWAGYRPCEYHEFCAGLADPTSFVRLDVGREGKRT